MYCILLSNFTKIFLHFICGCLTPKTARVTVLQPAFEMFTVSWALTRSAARRRTPLTNDDGCRNNVDVIQPCSLAQSVSSRWFRSFSSATRVRYCSLSSAIFSTRRNWSHSNPASFEGRAAAVAATLILTFLFRRKVDGSTSARSWYVVTNDAKHSVGMLLLTLLVLSPCRKKLGGGVIFRTVLEIGVGTVSGKTNEGSRRERGGGSNSHLPSSVAFPENQWETFGCSVPLYALDLEFPLAHQYRSPESEVAENWSEFAEFCQFCCPSPGNKTTLLYFVILRETAGLSSAYQNAQISRLRFWTF